MICAIVPLFLTFHIHRHLHQQGLIIKQNFVVVWALHDGILHMIKGDQIQSNPIKKLINQSKKSKIDQTKCFLGLVWFLFCENRSVRFGLQFHIQKPI